MGRITTSSDRSKSETMNYVLVLNEDYTEKFEHDKNLSERLTPDQCSRNEFLVMQRHNGTKLFHCVKNEDGNTFIGSDHNKILDICLGCGLKAICVPEHQTNQPDFYESLRTTFCLNGIDVTVLVREQYDNNAVSVHSRNLHESRRDSRRRMQHRRTMSIVGNRDASRRLNFDIIPEQMEE